MHPNPAFRQMPQDNSLAFARERAFGVLSVNHVDGPLISHIPFLVSDDGGSVDLHLVRSNPILQALPARAVIAISGPDSYISPDWYGAPDQVPTWNYVAVHLRGALEPLPQDQIRGLIDRQTAYFEDILTPKTPWTSAKMTPDVLERMMRTIVPCRMQISDVQSTWKLNQNKPADLRRRAAAEVAGYGIGHEPAMLSALMSGVPEE